MTTNNKIMNATPVSEIMTKNVVCVTPEQKIVDVKHIYEKQDFHHHIPVIEENKLVGMVSLVDFMYRIKGAGLEDSNAVYNELTVKDIMTPNPHYTTQDVPIVDIANELSEGNYRALPVVQDMRVVGIVSTADIIRYFLNS